MATLSSMPRAPTLKQLPSVFTSARAKSLGVPERQIYAWRDEGSIELLGRGLFMKAGTTGDPDLIEIAARSQSATLCLVSALARHGLTDRIPSTIHVAIPRSKRSPSTSAPVSWHRFDEPTFEVGRERILVTKGLELGVYSPIRSIVDSFRLRHLEGQDLAIEALRKWLRKRGSQPSALLAIAQHFPTSVRAIRAALEVIL
jgi:hypothetical protein